ncbi:MAG: hypothetical protein M3083_18645 [Actinomycetota bacterium]|nr:hypothetical protein [Actinomycetota bacterium]
MAKVPFDELYCTGGGHADGVGDLAGLAVDEDRHVSVNMVRHLLAGLAFDSVDRLGIAGAVD